MDRFGRFGSAMTGWWSNTVADDAVQSPSPLPPRKARFQQTHVEIIGGNRGPRAADVRSVARQDVIGPPRLPQELILQIITLAANDVSTCWNGRLKSTSLLSLAATSRASYKLIVNGTILPDLHLTGVRQVQAFANALRTDALGLRKDAQRIRRLTIKRVGKDAFGHSSLYRDVEETKQFERTTLAPLRIILAYCTGLQHLSLDVTARVLDPRTGYTGDKGSWQLVTQHLKELIILQSLYGGDLNERLWDTLSAPASPPRPFRWMNLSHLQLHGPRFRMTAATAIALAQLPALTHLALIMPWIVTSTAEGNAANVAGSSEQDRQLAAATDALGRRNVWQLLVDGLASRLQVLLLVCHDIDGYLGSVQKLGPSFRTIQWRCPEQEEASLLFGDPQRREARMSELRARAPQLLLVTANALWTGDERQEEAHPICFSRWMLHRAEHQQQWSFADGEADVIDSLTITTHVESWRAPVLLPSSPQQSSATSEPSDVPMTDGTARRWVNIEESVVQVLDPRHIYNSIDDLD